MEKETKRAILAQQRAQKTKDQHLKQLLFKYWREDNRRDDPVGVFEDDFYLRLRKFDGRPINIEDYPDAVPQWTVDNRISGCQTGRNLKKTYIRKAQVLYCNCK